MHADLTYKHNMSGKTRSRSPLSVMPSGEGIPEELCWHEGHITRQIMLASCLKIVAGIQKHLAVLGTSYFPLLRLAKTAR